MSNTRVIIAAAVLLHSVGVGYTQQPSSGDDAKQNLIQCLQRAEAEYSRQWTNHCPGGMMINPNCKLPRYIADSLGSDLEKSRNFCFQANGAGLLTR
jgi:hypothetical protein